MNLSKELTWRGLIKDKTFGDVAWLDTPRAFYLGIDASADSLTVGNLAIIMLARRLAAAGWKAVLVMGGGTSLVGDPGGKTEERQLMSRETIEKNVAGVRAQVQSLFKDLEFTMVDNYDWLHELKYLDFIRDVGKHFSMTELMQRDFVNDRMGEGAAGISYTEFSYSLVQGYDFWHLFKDLHVVMQIGGSDQWGNMLSGVALIRKKENQDAHALSMPLIINKATGVKFGKSEGGAVWLDPAKTSVYKFYQFWLNVDDEGVEDYLKIYTLLSKDDIEAVMREFQDNRGGRAAQKKLAYEVTKLVHGQDQADKQVHIAEAIAKQDLHELNDAELATIREEVAAARAKTDSSIAQLLVETKLAGSNTEANRLLQENAISVNGQKMNRPNFEAGDFQNGRLLLRRGKAFKDSALVELDN